MVTFYRLAKGTKVIFVDDNLEGICNEVNDDQKIPLLIDHRRGCWGSIHRVLGHGAATEYEFRIPRGLARK